MKDNSLFKQKSLVLATALCLLPTGNVSAEETGFVNTLPIYSEQTFPSTLTLPLFRFQGDEDTLHTGTLELDWKASQFGYYSIMRYPELLKLRWMTVFQRALLNNWSKS